MLESGYRVWWQLSKLRVRPGKFGNLDDGIVWSLRASAPGSFPYMPVSFVLIDCTSCKYLHQDLFDKSRTKSGYLKYPSCAPCCVPTKSLTVVCTGIVCFLWWPHFAARRSMLRIRSWIKIVIAGVQHGLWRVHHQAEISERWLWPIVCYWTAMKNEFPSSYIDLHCSFLEQGLLHIPVCTRISLWSSMSFCKTNNTPSFDFTGAYGGKSLLLNTQV